MPAVARIGDTNAPHCGGHNMAEGSSSVFANGIGVCRLGDSTTVHLMPNPGPPPPCVNHAAPVNEASPNVYADGIKIARMNDGIAGCTSIAQGSNNVFAN